MMKKLLAVLMSSTLVAAMAGTALAAEIVPSVTAKAPAEVISASSGDQDIELKDGGIYITPADEVADSDVISDEDKAKMDDVLAELDGAETSEELIENIGMTEEVNEALAGTGLTSKDTVVQMVFDITVTSEEAKAALASEDGLTLTLKVDGVSAGDTVVLLHYTGDGWEVVEAEVDEDGNVVATLHSASPYILMTAVEAGSDEPENPDEPEEPGVEDENNNPSDKNDTNDKSGKTDKTNKTGKKDKSGVKKSPKTGAADGMLALSLLVGMSGMVCVATVKRVAE